MMIFQNKKFSFLALSVSILSLNACGFSHPNAMPSGYTYHHEDYKSPIPPTSSKITVEQRKYMDATQAEQFRDAVYDLLERLTMRAGMPPKPVYILAPDQMTTFYTNIDNDLRESMRHIGYAISDTPTDAYIFTYEAAPIEQAASDSPNVHLTLRVFNELSETARQLTEESGSYFIQGVHELNIATSRYNMLPSQTEIQEYQVQQASQTQPAAIIEEPVIAAPSIRPPEPMATVVPTAPTISAPKVSAPIIPETKAIRPVIKKPEVSMPKVSKPDMAVSIKKPSRDDIVIINRGDKTVKESVSQAIPEAKNALQEAIPTTKKAVRGRISAPADY